MGPLARNGTGLVRHLLHRADLYFLPMDIEALADLVAKAIEDSRAVSDSTHHIYGPYSSDSGVRKMPEIVATEVRQQC